MCSWYLFTLSLTYFPQNTVLEIFYFANKIINAKMTIFYKSRSQLTKAIQFMRSSKSVIYIYFLVLLLSNNFSNFSYVNMHFIFQ